MIQYTTNFYYAANIFSFPSNNSETYTSLGNEEGYMSVHVCAILLLDNKVHLLETGIDYIVP